MEITQYVVLYETGNSGCFLGKFSNYHDADSLFNKIVKDLSKTISKHKIQDSFFEMYAVFQIPALCLEYERYKIANHKNQILKPEINWSTPDFCLYIIKTRNGFNVNKLKRAQNHFFCENSKYIEGSINLIMN